MSERRDGGGQAYSPAKAAFNEFHAAAFPNEAPHEEGVFERLPAAEKAGWEAVGIPLQRKARGRGEIGAGDIVLYMGILPYPVLHVDSIQGDFLSCHTYGGSDRHSVLAEKCVLLADAQVEEARRDNGKMVETARKLRERERAEEIDGAKGGHGIGWAIKQMLAGRRVQRPGWNGKGMFLYLCPADTTPEGRQVDPYIVMRTAQGTFQPGWLASQQDLRATDWEWYRSGDVAEEQRFEADVVRRHNWPTAPTPEADLDGFMTRQSELDAKGETARLFTEAAEAGVRTAAQSDTNGHYYATATPGHNVWRWGPWSEDFARRMKELHFRSRVSPGPRVEEGLSERQRKEAAELFDARIKGCSLTDRVKHMDSKLLDAEQIRGVIRQELRSYHDVNHGPSYTEGTDCGALPEPRSPAEHGQQAYQRYTAGVGGTTFDGKPLPTWDDLGDRQKAGWCATAGVPVGSNPFLPKGAD